MLSIYIPTRNRLVRQLTFTLLPPFLREVVTFVVPEQEYDAFIWHYPNTHVVSVPNYYHVGQVRQAISQMATTPYWMMDDDITSLGVTDASGDREATEQDWRQLVNDSLSKIDEGFAVLGLRSQTFTFNPRWYPLKEGLPGFQWFIMDHRRTNNLEWDVYPLHEDFHAMLIAITQGLRIGRFEGYHFTTRPCGQPGGCAEYRTAKLNEDLKKVLRRRWSRYVKDYEPTFALAYDDYKKKRVG